MNEKETPEIVDNGDLQETAAVDTLNPGAGSGGTESKALMLATFTQLLAQLGKEDLSNIFNQVQAQFGPNQAPGAVDNSQQNLATIQTKPSAATGGAVKEDIDEMFGEELSEDMKEKAGVIFEAAVNTRITIEEARLQEAFDAKVEELEESFNQRLEEETAAIFEDLTTKLDQYLDYCAEQWMEENKLAIENSLRADIAEGFIQGLHDLFAEHYIRVPDEKIDLVAEMKAELEEVKSKLNETLDEKIELETVINEATKQAAIDDVCEGLALTQAEKLRTLAEGLEYTDGDSYRKKLEIVKENIFKKTKTASTGLISEEIDGEDTTEAGTTGYTAPGMDLYLQAIKKSVK